MGIGETGVGEMGVGETGPNLLCMYIGAMPLRHSSVFII